MITSIDSDTQWCFTWAVSYLYVGVGRQAVIFKCNEQDLYSELASGNCASISPLKG